LRRFAPAQEAAQTGALPQHLRSTAVEKYRAPAVSNRQCRNNGGATLTIA
jgi:hypothetical protein